MEIEQDERAVETMLREADYSAISAQENNKSGNLDHRETVARRAISMEQLIDEITAWSFVSARFILMASAGLGKTVFLKKLCIAVNQRAVDLISTCAPIAIFVRAGADIVVILLFRIKLTSSVY